MERSHTFLIAAWTTMLSMGAPSMQAAPPAHLHDDLYQRLQHEPARVVEEDGARYWLVNDRHEAVTSRKAARRQTTFIMRVAPAHQGWSVQVWSADHVLLMDGTSLDPEGRVLDGTFTFRDTNGRLRAEGRYDHGRKTGVWRRYSEQGTALQEKTYYGEDRDALQVRVGLASMSNDLGGTAVSVE